jgi:hypothetical protein
MKILQILCAGAWGGGSEIVLGYDEESLKRIAK